MKTNIKITTAIDRDVIQRNSDENAADNLHEAPSLPLASLRVTSHSEIVP